MHNTYHGGMSQVWHGDSSDKVEYYR
jgi:hypothetical protein